MKSTKKAIFVKNESKNYFFILKIQLFIFNLNNINKSKSTPATGRTANLKKSMDFCKLILKVCF